MSSLSYAQLLRQNRNFRLLWGGQVVSQLGDWFNLITLQSLLLHLTGAASSVGVLMVAQLLPHVLLGPMAGVVVDRIPRRTVMIVSDLVRAALALGFLLIRGPETAWLAYAFIAALNALSVFFEPARQAITPLVTHPDELVAANALSSVTWSVLLTAGGLFGGLVATFLGPQAAFLLNSVSFLASALFIQRVRLVEESRLPRTSAASGFGDGFGDLKAGLRYVAGRRELSALLSVKALWGVAGGSHVLIAIFGQQVFPMGRGLEPLGISLLTAASGVGTAIGPILARRLTGSEPRRMYWVIPAGYLIGGVFFLALGQSWSLATAGATLFLGRMGGSALWVYSTILLQMTSEDRFRGRVFASEQTLFTLTMALSSFAVGSVVDRGVTAFTVATCLGAFSLAPGLAWCVGLRRGAAVAATPTTP